MRSRSKLMGVLLALSAILPYSSLEAQIVADHNHPYGIRMGTPIEELPVKNKAAPYIFELLEVPQPSKSFVQYQVVAVEPVGVCGISAFSAQTDRDAAISLFNRLKSEVTDKFGGGWDAIALAKIAYEIPRPAGKDYPLWKPVSYIIWGQDRPSKSENADTTKVSVLLEQENDEATGFRVTLTHSFRNTGLCLAATTHQ